MATTNFITGTVVSKEWLNDVDAFVYEGITPGTTSLNINTINEKTTNAGVTVEGILIKDSIVSTDTIAEKTAATGVTIDSVLLKDGTVSPTTPLSHRNKFINGDFQIWQRGNSLSSGTGVRYAGDRWKHNSVGTTYTAARQSFTIGQTDVPGEPQYYLEVVTTSSAGSGNYYRFAQFIENVRTFAGQNTVLTFYAKANTTKNIAVECSQFFGTGGSPSSQVYSIGVTTCALTSSWQKFTVPITWDSISGKTIGTSNDSYICVFFWTDAGSSFDARTNTLGQTSGTYNFARMQIERGSVATPFEDRTVQDTFLACKRYYQKSFYMGTAPAQNVGYNTGESYWFPRMTGATGIGFEIPLVVPMYDVPTVTLYNPSAANAEIRNYTLGADCSSSSAGIIQKERFLLSGTGNASGAVGNAHCVHWTAEAEL